MKHTIDGMKLSDFPFITASVIRHNCLKNPLIFCTLTAWWKPLKSQTQNKTSVRFYQPVICLTTTTKEQLRQKCPTHSPLQPLTHVKDVSISIQSGVWRWWGRRLADPAYSPPPVLSLPFISALCWGPPGRPNAWSLHPAVWGGHLLLYATGVVLQRPGCAGRCPLWVFCSTSAPAGSFQSLCCYGGSGMSHLFSVRPWLMSCGLW